MIRKFTLSFMLILFLTVLFSPHIASAQGTLEESCNIAKPSEGIRLNIRFPVQGVIFELPKGSGAYYVKNFGCYIGGFYKYFAGVAGILAVVMIMWGGYKYITSFGNPSRLQDAKDNITQALIGLTFVLGTYVVLYTINPNLVILGTPKLEPIKGILLSTQWCPEGAVPLQEGKNMCGDPGVIDPKKAGGECVFNSCEKKEICVQGTKSDPLAKIYSCKYPQDACEMHVSLDEINEQLCNQYTVADAPQRWGDEGRAEPLWGKCVWYNASWITLFDPDRCEWAPALDCTPGWTRVGCSECRAVTGCPSLSGGQTGEGGTFGGRCEANESGVIFQRDPGTPFVDNISGKEVVSKTVQGICCKKNIAADQYLIGCFTSPAQYLTDEQAEKAPSVKKCKVVPGEPKPQCTPT